MLVSICIWLQKEVKIIHFLWRNVNNKHWGIFMVSLSTYFAICTAHVEKQYQKVVCNLSLIRQIWGCFVNTLISQ